MQPSFLAASDISKSFGGVAALRNVSLNVARGEIHAVMGENGAGKSTLMKILCGVYPAGSYEGSITLDGRPARFHNVREAEAAGVVMIPQELAVVGELTVAENMFLNAWPARGGVIDWTRLYDEARRTIERLGIHVPFDAPMKSLSAAQQQMVLIAKALQKNVRVLVLDEPTSSLSAHETDILFDRLRHLRAAGITALYISHKIDEVKEITDTVTVLRDGQYVGTQPTSALSGADIVTMMVGRTISQMYPRTEREPGQPRLTVRGFTLYDPASSERPVVRDVNLEARAGEIVGIYGLMGSGRTELLTGLFGAWPGRWQAERFEVSGKPVRPTSPRAMMARGVGFLTEDRKRNGMVPGGSVAMNITLASLARVSLGPILNRDMERERAQRFIGELGVKTPSPEAAISTLSGGNQQKALIGRWLSAESMVLLLDEPTRGVDVGAKVEIFQLLNRLAAQGAAVIFVSSELPEVLGVADRVVVMNEGRIVADLPRAEATQERVVGHAAGGHH
jgi:D-xylose transport system ATP-binding protein